MLIYGIKYSTRNNFTTTTLHKMLWFMNWNEYEDTYP